MPAITSAPGASPSAQRWASRPALAWSVRAAAWLGPVLVSTATVLVASRLMVRPREMGAMAVWVLGMLTLGTVTLWVTERAFRRLLPLAAMLQLSLAFPDAAPSRFKVALRGRGAPASADAPATANAGEELAGLLARLHAYDRRSRGHAERVRAYTAMLGQELRLGAEDLDRLQWAALLHDVGKLAVPTEILGKASSLAEDEVALMRSHPAEGARLIEPARWWLGEWADAVAQHHEHFDGGGYPLHLAGTDISYAGRIVAVAEAYESMTSGSSYRSALGAADARAELTRCAGTQFDPVVVRAFLSLSLGRFERPARPLAWLSHVPVLATAPLGNAAAAVAIGTAALLVNEVQMPQQHQPSELVTSLAVGLDALMAPIPSVAAHVAAPSPSSDPASADPTSVDPNAGPLPVTTVPAVPTTAVPEPTSTLPDVTPAEIVPASPDHPPVQPETSQPEAAPTTTAPTGPVVVTLANAVVARNGSVTIPLLARSGAVALFYVACEQGSSWFSGTGDPVTISPQGATAPYSCEFQADLAGGGLVSGTFTVVPL